MRIVLLLLAASLCYAQYNYGPDSARHPGVPKGAVTQHQWTSTKHFPGTVRDYWVYVPAQYRRDRPAPVMVFQDGGGYVTETGHSRIPIVFDNLIHKGDMPPTIAILINPGILPALRPDQQSRYNRSFEYDAMSDTYARFLIEEILPEVAKGYNLSNDPNDRAIAGSSSGGIAAFTAAWHRPDAFRRVLSFIGSYTNLRGGHHWSSLIRKTEGKPLRVYLQDGRNDQNIYSGNWFIGNQDMASALEYAGYDTTFVIGEEGHNMRHGGPIMPDALRWLWRDYPKPIAKPTAGGSRRAISEFLDPASEWEMVSSGYKFTEGPAVDRDANIFFTDIPNNRIHKIAADGKVTIFKEDTGGANGLMFGPDGKLYACQNRKQRIVAYSMDGAETVIADGVTSNDLVITATGNIYFTDPPKKSVWLIDAQRNKRVVHEGIEFPNGVMLSPDQSLLTVADYRGNRVWSFQIQPDGSLANGQPFYKLEVPDEAVASAADGMTMDSEGFLYVATRLGVQICDQPGRVVGIINKPHGGALANAVFGGKDLSWLYVAAGDRIYRRHMRRTGVWPWVPVMPPKPRL
ncbi:MAG: SMP-30/gluconolactonase/LRE family protein [Bryobacteraceae bacterium]